MNTEIEKLTENIRFEAELIADHSKKERYSIAKDQLKLVKLNIEKLEKILNERSGVDEVKKVCEHVKGGYSYGKYGYYKYCLSCGELC